MTVSVSDRVASTTRRTCFSRWSVPKVWAGN